MARRSVSAGTKAKQIAQVDSFVAEGSFQRLENPAVDATASVQPVQAKVRQTIPVQPLIVPVPRVMPAALRGSHDVLVHQNIVADVEGLSRIQNDAQIREMLAEHLLVSLPVGKTLEVDPRLPANRRYCRPWTADFLSNIAHEHNALFQRPLQVNSAVRTVQFQQHLERINENAAPATGDTASPHLTGATIDIAKKGMSSKEIGWMRDYLGRLQDAGKLDVEEEFQQSCFHISVYKTYEPASYPFMTSPSSTTPSRNLTAKAGSPHLVATSSAPERVVHHSSTRRHRHHVPVSLLATRMQ